MILNQYGMPATPMRPELLAILQNATEAMRSFGVSSRIVDQFGRAYVLPPGEKVGGTITVKMPNRYHP